MGPSSCCQQAGALGHSALWGLDLDPMGSTQELFPPSLTRLPVLSTGHPSPPPPFLGSSDPQAVLELPALHQTLLLRDGQVTFQAQTPLLARSLRREEGKPGQESAQGLQNETRAFHRQDCASSCTSGTAP